MSNGRTSGREQGRGSVAGLLFRALGPLDAAGRVVVVHRLAALEPGARARLLGLADWHKVVTALWAPIAGEAEHLPQELAAALEAASALNVRRNDRLLRQAGEIAATTAAAGIDAVFLKGTAILLCALHPDRAARQVGDIDLLVPPERIEDTAAALAAAGYRRLPDRVLLAHDPVRLLREDRPAVIELHQSPLAFALCPALSGAAVLERAVDAPQLSGARIPCPDDIAVQSIAHALLQDHGLLLGEYRLRDALDLARLADGRIGAIDWETVAERLARVPGGRDAFAFALAATREAVAAPLPRADRSRRAASRITAWRRRAGQPAPALARRLAYLDLYAGSLIRRLRDAPAERRRLLRNLASATAWARLVKTFATIVTDAPPATPDARPGQPQ